jgi:serine protease
MGVVSRSLDRLRAVASGPRSLVIGGVLAASALIVLVALILLGTGPSARQTASLPSPTGAARAESPTPTAVASSSATATRAPETLPPVELEVAIDSSLRPVIASVPPLEDGGSPRPVGRTVTADGLASDFVVGEVAVVVPDSAAVAELRQRDDVEVVAVDDEDFDAEDGIPVLLRIRRPADIDTTRVAHDLVAVGDGLRGELRVSDADTVATLAVMARLAVADGLEASLNDVPVVHDIPEGRAIERLAASGNAFDWFYVKSTAAQGIGLDTAWQMLYHAGREENRVKVMVVDRGFEVNADLPAVSALWGSDWGPADNWNNSGGVAIPYHGTQVAIVAAGQVDNDYGTAGPAGPFTELVMLHLPGGSWENLREIERVARVHEPDVINMSYGSVVTSSVGATKKRFDRTFKRIAQRYGGLAFASAGNEGLDVDKVGGPYLPCASTRVICVGGMGVDTTTKAQNSNFGSERDDRSVEIYGPFCVYTLTDPSKAGEGWAKTGCGTSFASPFVAGVAALLRVADPALTPEEMAEILYDTAHVGGLGQLATGHLRRIDAHMAVARALGLTWTQPTVTVTDGPGSYPLDEVISFGGTARSFSGEKLPIRWHSSIDGWLNEKPQKGSIGAVLSPGDHLIQASAIDRRGFSGVAPVLVTVENEPPTIAIVAPDDGATIYEGTALHLVGYSHDPDIYVNQSLADDQVHWTIERTSGQLVWESDGHVRATALDVGKYVIRFRGTDAQGASAEDTVELTVLELEPGWVPPIANIIKPVPGTTLNVGNNKQTVELQGNAFGVDGAAISGQRFRWTATSDNGQTITLCTGSGFPGGGGGLGVATSCAQATVELGLASGAVGRTVWALRLEAVDNQGVPVTAVRDIEVVFATG